jgi:hypothetical protein
MMTNGPAAEVGDILEIKFPRPRDRKALLNDPEYYRLREHLIGFLEDFAHKPEQQKSIPANSKKDSKSNKEFAATH